MILCGSSTNLVSALGRECEMVGLLGMSEDDAVEAVVILKLGEYHEVKPLSIHLGNGSQMVGRTGDTEHSIRLHQ